MRVCVLTTCYPRFVGDRAGIFVRRLVDALARAGIAPQVVAPGHKYAPAFEQHGKAAIHRFTYFLPSLQKVAYGAGGLPETLRRDCMAIAQLPLFSAAFMRESIFVARECQIIHANWLLAGLYAVLVRNWVGCPVVVTLRGSDGRAIRSSGFVRWLARWIFDRADAVTAVSEDLARICLETGCAPSKVTVIPNGVYLPPPPDDGTRPRLGEEEGREERIILFVGNLTENKGVDVLLRALPSVCNRIPHARAAVVGTGPEQHKLKRLARSLGLAERVTWAGSCPPDEVYRWYRAADVLALPSYSEGRPNVVLEAMSCGLPVVASRVEGVREIVVDGSTGFLHPAGDSDGLAERLVLVLLQPSLAARLGEKGYRRLTFLGLTWDECAASYVQTFRKTLARSGLIGNEG